MVGWLVSRGLGAVMTADGRMESLEHAGGRISKVEMARLIREGATAAAVRITAIPFEGPLPLSGNMDALLPTLPP